MVGAGLCYSASESTEEVRTVQNVHLCKCFKPAGSSDKMNVCVRPISRRLKNAFIVTRLSIIVRAKRQRVTFRAAALYVFFNHGCVDLPILVDTSDNI